MGLELAVESQMWKGFLHNHGLLLLPDISESRPKCFTVVICTAWSFGGPETDESAFARPRTLSSGRRPRRCASKRGMASWSRSHGLGR